jgi:diacylglycerol kinase family enzyme
MPRTLLVANPAGRAGRTRALIPVVVSALQDRGMDVTVVETSSDGATSARVTREITSPPGFALTVVLGGDGTFAEVARGLLDAPLPRPPVALLPAGTANNHAKSLGIAIAFDDLDRALTVLDGETLHMDAGVLSTLDEDGEVTNRLRFFDSVGWGLQGEVFTTQRSLVNRLDHSTVPLAARIARGEVGVACAGAWGLARSVFTPTVFSADVRVDGELLHHPRLLDLVISASSWYGGRWVLDPTSRVDDGLFEQVAFAGVRELVIRGVNDLGTTSAPRVLTRRAVTPVRKGRRFEIHLHRSARPRVSSQVDGEPGPAGARFTVEVEPSILEVLVPPPVPDGL